MLIREAGPNDFDTMLGIAHKFFEFNAYRQHSSIDDKSMLETFWNLHMGHVLLVVVTDDNKVVGMAGAMIGPVFWNSNHIQGLEMFWWVDVEYRKGGIGSQLRMELQAAAEAKGVKFWNMVALKESMHDQVCAQYERAGFTPVETVYMKVL